MPLCSHRLVVDRDLLMQLHFRPNEGTGILTGAGINSTQARLLRRAIFRFQGTSTTDELNITVACASAQTIDISNDA
ncbi:hypothetical protein ETAA8_43270 [Anatilimnocola aggregata]|uniref:Uncharacterized protein n=1 Tax=Anatilimnocola aggregata TaxID=2528021 RepID=A0A517YG67_9BACT|nr:hypothetical protein ETAA8_43270 [Anatilimnocola aggregata]